MQQMLQKCWLKSLDYIRRIMDEDLVNFLADPDNVEKFIGVALADSLGFKLTEDGEWVRLDS